MDLPGENRDPICMCLPCSAQPRRPRWHVLCHRQSRSINLWAACFAILFKERKMLPGAKSLSCGQLFIPRLVTGSHRLSTARRSTLLRCFQCMIQANPGPIKPGAYQWPCSAHAQKQIWWMLNHQGSAPWDSFYTLCWTMVWSLTSLG